jgi:hypothetical protein
MKKNSCLLIFFLCSYLAFSQDTIRFKNNDTKVVRVNEIGVNEIKYNRFDNLDGPTYVAAKNEVRYIRYANGQIDKFNDVSTANPALNTNQPTASSGSPFLPRITFKGKKMVYGGRGLGESKL